MIPVPPLAFLDANILFSRTLRDWICLLSLESQCTIYDLRWSEDVLAEWIYKLRRKNPNHNDQVIGNRRRELEAAFPDRVVMGYAPVSVPALNDPNDRHVLAAAVHGEADILVAADLKAGFKHAAQRYGIEVHTPDEFLMWATEDHAALVLSVLRRQLDYYNRNVIVTGGRSADDLIASLRKANAPHFACRVEELVTESNPPAEPGDTNRDPG